MKFYDLDGRLVISDGDNAAVWSTDHKTWLIGGVPLARRAMTDGILLSQAEAKKEFPFADWANMTDFAASE